MEGALLCQNRSEFLIFDVNPCTEYGIEVNQMREIAKVILANQSAQMRLGILLWSLRIK